MNKYLIAAFTGVALMLGGCGKTGEGESAGKTGDQTIEAVEEIEAPPGKIWSSEVRKTDAGGYVMGNPKAAVKLVEFLSLSCTHCADFADQAFVTIRDKYVASGRVSFEVRNFVRDPIDLTAVILTRCGGEAPFFALTEQALSNQRAMFERAQAMGDQRYNQILKLPEDSRFVTLAQEIGLIDFFKTRGISSDQARSCLSDPSAAQELIDQTQAGQKQYDVPGTPYFLINGEKVAFSGWPELENQLQQSGAR